jgi:hypothetical protein
MLPDINSLLYEQAVPAANSILEKALAGDVSTIALLGIAAIVLFVMIVLLIELAAWLINLVKRFLLFVIVAVSVGLFFFSFQGKIFSAEPDLSLVLAGIIGIAFALVALAISFTALRREWRKPKEQKVAELKTKMRMLASDRFDSEFEGAASKAARPEVNATQVQQPSMLSSQALSPSGFFASFHDRSILAVLSYMVVAEFGVISGITVAAPSVSVGLVFFAMFLVAALVFIKSTYHYYLTGIRHLLIALAIGSVLSVILSHVWLSVPLETLLSPAYFQTNALVALVTGLAVSLFMGSKA